MPLFFYRAVDPSGTSADGRLEAATAAMAVKTLEEQGYQVNAIEPVVKVTGYQRLKGALNWDDLHLLSAHLLAVARSGLPLPMSLEGLARDVSSRRLRGAVNNLRERVEAGSSLGSALDANTPHVFPPLFSSMVRAGERTGNLTGVLVLLMEHARRVSSLRGQMLAALAYPGVVTLAALVVQFFLIASVLPQISLLENGAGRNGIVSRLAFFFVSLTQIGWPWFGAGIAIAAGLAFVAWKVLGWRQLFYALFRVQPFFGKYLRLSAQARFVRALGLLTSSGVPLVDAMELAGAAGGNPDIESAALQAAGRVSAGYSLSESLAATGYFDHISGWFLAGAEERGDIPEALLHAADTLEQRVASMDRALVTASGPIAVLAVGGIVVATWLLVLLPLYGIRVDDI